MLYSTFCIRVYITLYSKVVFNNVQHAEGNCSSVIWPDLSWPKSKCQALWSCVKNSVRFCVKYSLQCIVPYRVQNIIHYRYVGCPYTHCVGASRNLSMPYCVCKVLKEYIKKYFSCSSIILSLILSIHINTLSILDYAFIIDKCAENIIMNQFNYTWKKFLRTTVFVFKEGEVSCLPEGHTLVVSLGVLDSQYNLEQTPYWRIRVSKLRGGCNFWERSFYLVLNRNS